MIELRLNAITAYKDKNFANELIKQAQAKRKKVAQKSSTFFSCIGLYFYARNSCTH